MDSKFKRVMDWGTPRLVSKTRSLTMSAKQLQSRQLLLKTAGVKSVLREEDAGTSTTGYTNSSVNSFRKRMMEEEKRSEAQDMQHRNLARKSLANPDSEDIDCDKLPREP